MVIASLRSAGLMAAVLVLSACASTRNPPAYGLDAGNAALVRQACGEVMGFNTNLAEFDACGASLARSLQLRQHDELIAQANDQCERQGFAPGTAALAQCVVQARAGGASRDQKAELTCAHLGLHPAMGSSFSQCVSNLKAAIFEAQNPAPL